MALSFMFLHVFAPFACPVLRYPKLNDVLPLSFFILIVNLAGWFSCTSVPTFITSDNDELSEVIKMLGNKDYDYSVNSIISDNF